MREPRARAEPHGSNPKSFPYSNHRSLQYYGIRQGTLRPEKDTILPLVVLILSAPSEECNVQRAKLAKLAITMTVSCAMQRKLCGGRRAWTQALTGEGRPRYLKGDHGSPRKDCDQT